MTNNNINNPKIEVRGEQPYVAIPIKVSLREWGKANALIGEVFEWINQKGIEIAGPPFFRYWRIGDMDNKFDIEVGVTVGKPVTGDGRVIASSIPSGKYATLVHTGHPDRLIHSLLTLQQWGEKEGIMWKNQREENEEVWGGRFEFYLTDPIKQPDLEKWSIEIAYLVEDSDNK